MGKGTRGRKYVGVFTRRTVADNITAALKDRYGDRKNHLGLFEEETGINFSTTQRIVKQQQGASIDVLEQIAEKLGLPVYALFIPTKQMERQLKPPDRSVLPTPRPSEQGKPAAHKGRHIHRK